MARNRWPLGRVVEVFTGQDGGVRSARIKRADGVFHRPITKICLLEEASDDKCSSTRDVIELKDTKIKLNKRTA